MNHVKWESKIEYIQNVKHHLVKDNEKNLNVYEDNMEML